MDRESVVFLVLGILSLSLGLFELIMIRRFASWDITLRGVAGIPGMFLFAGALQLSIASGSLFMAMAFFLCMFASLVVGTILWFRGETWTDRLKKMNEK